MEVSLLSTNGVPEGCHLSIRMGETRQQAPLPGRSSELTGSMKLRFPYLPREEEIVKADLLVPLQASVEPATDAAHAGSAASSMHLPRELKLSSQGGTMHLSLQLSKEGDARWRASPRAEQDEVSAVQPAEAGLQQGKPPAGPKLAAEDKGLASAAKEARAYLDKHDLLQWMQLVMQDLLRDQPTDPWRYIDAHTERMRQRDPAVAARGRGRQPAQSRQQQQQQQQQQQEPHPMLELTTMRPEQQPLGCLADSSASLQGKADPQHLCRGEVATFNGFSSAMESTQVQAHSSSSSNGMGGLATAVPQQVAGSSLTMLTLPGIEPKGMGSQLPGGKERLPNGGVVDVEDDAWDSDAARVRRLFESILHASKRDGSETRQSSVDQDTTSSPRSSSVEHSGAHASTRRVRRGLAGPPLVSEKMLDAT
mmetsp:Transcript_25101/g.58267  ORF Transcript_25101/g.58267 Transcript_25101/m.58267 type:complete len:423 (-) Transcript_25101:46-1314(-)